MSRLYKNILQITMALHGYPRLQGGFASHICHEHDDEDCLAKASFTHTLRWTVKGSEHFLGYVGQMADQG
jgi:hypothetical protein